MKLDLPIMDFSNLSRRGDSLELEKLIDSIEPGSHVIVDSTGLKVYGKDEWHQAKYNALARRTWCKLHIIIDERHQILACELTTPNVSDETALPNLLKQIDEVGDCLADGAYDGQPTYKQIKTHSPNANIVIPPPKNVVAHTGNLIRDQHTQYINEHGRMLWQKKINDGLRSYVELAIQRYKRIIGNTLKSRALPQQKTEAQVSGAR